MTSVNHPVRVQETISSPAPYAPTLYQCYDAARLLAESFVGKPEVTTVIGIYPGGVRPAAVMAEYLRVNLYVVSTNTQPGPSTESTSASSAPIRLPGDLPVDLEGRVLLVNDMTVSGATFTAFAKALRGQLGTGAVIETVALCRHMGCSRGPNRWVWSVDGAVAFPWEVQPRSADTRALPVPRRVMTP